MIVYGIRLKGTDLYLSKDGTSSNNFRVFTKIQSARMALKTLDDDRSEAMITAAPMEIVPFDLVEVDLETKLKALFLKSRDHEPSPEEIEQNRKDFVVNEMLAADPNLPRTDALKRYDEVKAKMELDTKK